MRSLLLFLCVTFSSFTFAQETYKIDSEKSKMTLSGKTNLSSWEEQVTAFKGSMIMSTENDKNQIHAVEIQIPVDAIEAPRKGMQTDTDEALKKEEHPEITFVGKHAKVDGGLVTIYGVLTITGVSRQVEIKAKIEQDNSRILLTGSYSLNMMDYTVKPPKAMFGTLQVEEQVDISFSLLFL